MNIRATVDQFGSWWHAVLFSFSVMSESVFPAMTAERRIAGTPVYPGSDETEAINYDDPAEWRQAGGKRIEAGRILQHAEQITHPDWPVITLAMHDNKHERSISAATIADRLVKQLHVPHNYAMAVCIRWGEKRFNRRHAGAVSREYRLTHTDTVDDLIKKSGWAEQKERMKRSEIIEILEQSFSDAKSRLDNA